MATRALSLDRRSFVRAAGAAFLASLSPRALLALETSDEVFASAYRDESGQYGLVLLTEQGRIIDRISLPGRAHGLAAHPASGQIAAFARRPGTFVLVTTRDHRQEPVVIASIAERHFFGHGCFSPDGRFLYAAENDFANQQGKIGIYNAGNHFRRVGEYDAFGIGTHDLAVSDDGRYLIAANGGIATHPDFGRTKLNLDAMQPSLALIDARSGALVERHALPETLRQLSTRHLALDRGGRIWFATQYEGSRDDRPPLAGYFAPGEDLTLVSLPPEATDAMGLYVGAIAVNREAGLVGLASPNHGAMVTLSAKDGSFVSINQLPDAAGIAASREKGFAVTSYRGDLGSAHLPFAFDQHLIRL